MVIKHLVFSGGGQYGLSVYSAIEYLKYKEYIKYENIESIYATSVGTVNAILFCLNIDKDIMCKYLIHRHWSADFVLNSDSFTNILLKKGLYEMNCFDNFFKPLFAIKDIDMNITMIDFYSKFNIYLEFNAICVNNFEIIKLNHNTYPDLPILKAVKMSCSIPFIFTPVVYNKKYFVDGGILINYPLEDCINNNKCDESEIFGIFLLLNKKDEDDNKKDEDDNKKDDDANKKDEDDNKKDEDDNKKDEDDNKKDDDDNKKDDDDNKNDDDDNKKDDDEDEIIDDNMNILGYVQFFFSKIFNLIDTSQKQIKIKNELNIVSTPMNLETIKQFISNKELREQLINNGEEHAKIFLDNNEM
jgi:predicted acylesterase/phospholipase RssA